MIIKNLILSKISNYNFKIIKIESLNNEFLKLINKNTKKLESDYKFLNKLKKLKNNHLDNFVFLLRTLDFRLWQYPQNWRYKNEKGFFGLMERLIKLFEVLQFKEKKYLDYKADFSVFKKIISPQENITLAKLRYKIFKYCLKWLRNYDYNFYNYFQENKDAFNFCFNLFELEKFKDYYKDIYFLKPNQLLYLEYLLAKNLTENYKNELETLTIFADYKIPQIFINLDLIKIPLKYLKILKQGKIIRKFSSFENELRCASILIGEEISQKLKIPNYKVDNILWELSHKIKLKIPNPKVKTIFY